MAVYPPIIPSPLWFPVLVLIASIPGHQYSKSLFPISYFLVPRLTQLQEMKLGNSAKNKRNMR